MQPSKNRSCTALPIQSLIGRWTKVPRYHKSWQRGILYACWHKISPVPSKHIKRIEEKEHKLFVQVDSHLLRQQLQQRAPELLNSLLEAMQELYPASKAIKQMLFYV